MIYDVIIVGGGAAGLYAASQLAYVSKGANIPLSVCVLEKTKRPGSKILVTGSGQCNITHGGSIKDFINCYGDHGKQVRKVLYAHNNSDVINHFNMLGVKTFEREDGKVFPVSLDAEEVRKALESHAAEAGFDIVTMRSVTAVSIDSEGIFNVHADSSSHIDPHYTLGRTLEEGRNSSKTSAPFKYCYKGRNVIIACGGLSYPGTGSDGSIFPILDNLGLEVTSMAPSLVPVNVNDYPYSEISGVSISGAELRLEGRKPMHGDLLFTHKSLSGPLIINNSRYIKPGMRIALSYLPRTDTATFAKALKDAAQGSKKNLETLLIETCEAQNCRIPKRLAELCVERTETALNAKFKAEKASSVSGKSLDLIARYLTNDQFTVNSLGSYNLAMCTAGGVSLSEIDLATMETKKYPHLFITGETLDIDGDTGGYNLQFAFSSAYAAVQKIIHY